MTKLFPIALCQFFQPSDLLVMVTKDAKTKWFEHLEKALEPFNIKPQSIDIRDGHSVEDLWDIFNRLTENLEEGDKVIFDITHSFRTLPFLSFLATTYLRIVKKVNIEGVYYGAWEARQPQSKDSLPTDRSPVFDLSPFMNLLELTTATDQFIKTGNGKALANLLPKDDQTTSSALANSINKISQGLHLLRPMSVMQEAAKLPEQIANAESIVSQSIPPFAALLKRVEKDYGELGVTSLTDFKEKENAKKALVKQLKMIEWYVEKEEIVHALSIAREWLPSLLCFHFNVDPLEKTEREDMELLLNGGKIKENEVVIKESPRLSEWPKVEARKQLRSLWGSQYNLANLRNDVLHAGFRKDPKETDKIIDQTKKILEELKKIATAWKLDDDAK